MGYTHYWQHRARFTNAEWATVVADLTVILETAHAEGLTIGDNFGERELASPRDAYAGGWLGFNGLGDDAHETFMVEQERAALESWQEPKDRGRAFCKTACKPYDSAVVACLCYLSSVYPAKVTADSDGGADDWQEGLALARRALPRLDNVLTIPPAIRFDSLFARHVTGCGRYAIAILQSGEWALADFAEYRVLGTFAEGDPVEWARTFAERFEAEHRRRMPAKVETLARFRARRMRFFRDAAESFGYLTAAPVET